MQQRFFPAALVSFGLFGCATSPATPPAPPPPAASPVPAERDSAVGTVDSDTTRNSTTQKSELHEITRLEVPILAKSGSTLIGEAELTESEQGVTVVVRIDRVTPGLHGVHIHEVPDCSAPDATSAGGHFNPEDNPHALPSAHERHLGDLGNIVVSEPDDEGRLEITVAGANLESDSPVSFLNRALIVHADYDKGTQPSGEAGDRIGCAELTVSAARQQARGEVVTR